MNLPMVWFFELAAVTDPVAVPDAAAAGTVPDLVYLDRQQVATLAAKGALQPLDSCVEEQAIDRSHYRPAALEEASYQDKLYALPEFTNQRTLIASTKPVQEAGLKVSDVQTTDWDKLKTVTKKLTKMEGGKIARIGFDPKTATPGTSSARRTPSRPTKSAVADGELVLERPLRDVAGRRGRGRAVHRPQTATR